MKTSELLTLIENNWDVVNKYPAVRLYVNIYRIMLVNIKPHSIVNALSSAISYLTPDAVPDLFVLLARNNYLENGKLNLFLDLNYVAMTDEQVAQAQAAQNNLLLTKPTTVDKIKSLTGALKDYATSGFKNCTEEQYQERLAICNGCEFFDKTAFMGAGKCRKCGCSGLKLKMGTSKCPIDKWGPVV